MSLRSAVLPLLLLLGALPAAGQTLVTNQSEALARLPGVYLLCDELSEAARGAGLSRAALLARVREDLHAASVPVLDEERWLQTPGSPVLFVQVTMEPSPSDTRWFGVRLELQELVAPLAQPDLNTYAIVWQADTSGVAAPDAPVPVLDTLRALSSRFAREYHEANAGASGRRKS